MYILINKICDIKHVAAWSTHPNTVLATGAIIHQDRVYCAIRKHVDLPKKQESKTVWSWLYSGSIVDRTETIFNHKIFRLFSSSEIIVVHDNGGVSLLNEIQYFDLEKGTVIFAEMFQKHHVDYLLLILKDKKQSKIVVAKVSNVVSVCSVETIVEDISSVCFQKHLVLVHKDKLTVWKFDSNSFVQDTSILIENCVGVAAFENHLAVLCSQDKQDNSIISLCEETVCSVYLHDLEYSTFKKVGDVTMDLLNHVSQSKKLKVSMISAGEFAIIAFEAQHKPKTPSTAVLVRVNLEATPPTLLSVLGSKSLEPTCFLDSFDSISTLDLELKKEKQFIESCNNITCCEEWDNLVLDLQCGSLEFLVRKTLSFPESKFLQKALENKWVSDKMTKDGILSFIQKHNLDLFDLAIKNVSDISEHHIVKCILENLQNKNFKSWIPLLSYPNTDVILFPEIRNLMTPIDALETLNLVVNLVNDKDPESLSLCFKWCSIIFDVHYSSIAAEPNSVLNLSKFLKKWSDALSCSTKVIGTVDWMLQSLKGGSKKEGSLSDYSIELIKI